MELTKVIQETSIVTFEGSETKKIWENKNNPNQRLSFEKTERHISFTVSDADNPKYLVLLYIERLYNDTDDIAKIENAAKNTSHDFPTIGNRHHTGGRISF